MTEPEKLVETESVRQTLVDPGSFGLLIADEAHKLKNPASLQTRACEHLSPDGYILAIATPTMLSVADLHGLVRFTWKQFTKGLESKEPPDLDGPAGYETAYKAFEADWACDYHDFVAYCSDEQKTWIVRPALGVFSASSCLVHHGSR